MFLGSQGYFSAIHLQNSDLVRLPPYRVRNKSGSHGDSPFFSKLVRQFIVDFCQARVNALIFDVCKSFSVLAPVYCYTLLCFDRNEVAITECDEKKLRLVQVFAPRIRRQDIQATIVQQQREDFAAVIWPRPVRFGISHCLIIDFVFWRVLLSSGVVCEKHQLMLNTFGCMMNILMDYFCVLREFVNNLL